MPHPLNRRLLDGKIPSVTTSFALFLLLTFA
jgi:hypothetical protein